MFSNNLLVAFVVFSLLGCSPEQVPQPTIGGVPVRTDVDTRTITALLACVVPATCVTPGKVETVGEEMLYATAYKEDQVSIQYFFTSEARFGVSITMSPTRKILLEDNDLDGIAERVTQTDVNDPKKVIVYGVEKKDKWWAAQVMYAEAMGVAEKQVIPPQLLDAARKQVKKKNTT